jgi:hypothetical protein
MQVSKTQTIILRHFLDFQKAKEKASFFRITSYEIFTHVLLFFPIIQTDTSSGFLNPHIIANISVYKSAYQPLGYICVSSSHCYCCLATPKLFIYIYLQQHSQQLTGHMHTQTHIHTGCSLIYWPNFTSVLYMSLRAKVSNKLCVNLMTYLLS